MKNEKWTEDLYLFRMKPAPPKKDDLQEDIALYCPEKDEKYLNSFFHYYEPRINTIIMQTVLENAMQGHFADLKQAYVFGIYKALQKHCLPPTKHLITVSARGLPIISDFVRNATVFMSWAKMKTVIRSSFSAKKKPT